MRHVMVVRARVGPVMVVRVMLDHSIGQSAHGQGQEQESSNTRHLFVERQAAVALTSK